jgi:dienelactone hydrolase
MRSVKDQFRRNVHTLKRGLTKQRIVGLKKMIFRRSKVFHSFRQDSLLKQHVAGAVLTFVAAASLAAPVPDRLPATNLLVYHNKTGDVSPVTSKKDWERRRAEIVEGCQAIMGSLPGHEKRCPLDVKTDKETDRGSYVERLISYASEPNSRVPAYLLIPKKALTNHAKVRAVLVLHPTDMEFGHRVVAEPLRATYRAYGRDLVERGFVVLAPSYPLMANYQPDLKSLGYKSGTMKAIWDNMRGLDLLESLPYVSRKGFAAIGHSLGGHNSIYTAVFDPRIKVIVSSCGFDSYKDYKGGDIRGWTSERYMPALLDYKSRLVDIPFDFSELLGALAPRALFINAPLRDSNFNWRSVDLEIAAARPIYNLYRAQGKIQVLHPDCEHDFPPTARDAAYEWIENNL